jgi:hypothetical protein
MHITDIHKACWRFWYTIGELKLGNMADFIYRVDIRGRHRLHHPNYDYVINFDIRHYRTTIHYAPLKSYSSIR